MIVGTTPSEPGTTTPSHQPRSEPAERADHAESRRALRAARRQRRRIAIGCGVFIALCLAVTLVIVGLARDRSTGGPQTVIPVAIGSAVHLDLRPAVAIPSTESPGAPAPTGGRF